MNNTAFLWPLFPLGFVALWLFVTWVIALCGWNRLREFEMRSPLQNHERGARFSLAYADIGGSRYNGALSIEVSGRGVWMQPIFLFRAFHPPLLIPFTAFDAPRVEKKWWMNRTTYRVQTPSKGVIEIEFSGEVVRAIEARRTRENTISPFSS